MAKRKFEFEDENYYHIYNRGVDKREIFLDKQDIQYFLDRILDFNNIDIFGSAKNMKFKERRVTGTSCDKRIVEILAWAVNPNHFHLILKQIRLGNNDKHKGIGGFAHRVFTGYAMFFNKKLKRNGALFQGKFKASQIYNEDHLKELVAYVNLNYKVHKLDPEKHVVRTSYDEYLGIHKGRPVCSKKEILGMFNNIEEFKKYNKAKIKDIIKERESLKKDMERFLE